MEATRFASAGRRQRCVGRPTEGPGALLVTATVDSTRSGEAAELIRAEISRLQARDRDHAEAFVRARRQVLGEMVAEGSGAESRADRIEWLIARGVELADSDRSARQVMDLTVEAARSALAGELDPARAIVAIAGAPDAIAAARRVFDPSPR
ncbi:MAG TPA: hypothetical protein VFU21_03910 [Kofleriaceae bacterium]|nr:hypothetical protein [Kofleriaceae bacterium]